MQGQQDAEALACAERAVENDKSAHSDLGFPASGSILNNRGHKWTITAASIGAISC
jgi:hypothetical protein